VAQVWDFKRLLKGNWYKYRGQYLGKKSANGKRNGQGKNYFPDRSVYEGTPKMMFIIIIIIRVIMIIGILWPSAGDWKDDERHGRGKCEWADGTTYDVSVAVSASRTEHLTWCCILRTQPELRMGQV
jgi:hypothetical protein